MRDPNRTDTPDVQEALTSRQVSGAPDGDYEQTRFKMHPDGSVVFTAWKAEK